jgi:general secretion pathway protein G
MEIIMNKTENKKRIDNFEKGMTLVELMIVLIILGLISTFAVVKLMDRLAEANIRATQAQIATLENALQFYKLSCNDYPSTDQGLEALISKSTVGKECDNYPDGGFLEKHVIPEDPWGNPYQYAYPGQNNTGSFDLWSMGKDEESNTQDDVVNWAKEGKE